uniref:MICOS complex subunit MIC60 n=1 Tax=Pinguiococcus pyrenoidosus TaxID=172671 RepID=A0A7R9YBK3_9STRA
MEQAETRARELRLRELEFTTEEVTALNVALRRELEATFLADAHTVGIEELRNRVASLVTILQERTRYEALRISEALRRAEEESARKYNALLEDQRKNLTMELNEHRQAMQLADVRAREEALALMKSQMEEKYQAELRLRTGDMERLLQQQIRRQELEFNAAVLDKVKELTDSRSEAYKQMAAEVGLLRSSVAETKALDAKSLEVHKITAAALSLAQKFETNEPFLQEANTLARLSSSAGPEISSLIEELPQDAMKKGIPTLPQLQYRFDRVKRAARHESNVPPEMPGFGGQIVASVTTFLTVPPKGLVKGSGPEERLARAAYFVQTGELAKAASEVSGLTGRAKAAVQDWLNDAESRIKADKVSAAITLQAASLNRRQLSQ